MNTQNLIWKKKISENQQFRSTWLVEIDGIEYIAKKIVSDNKAKLESLAKNLKKQVRFSEILNKEEQKQICLYETSFEEDNYIAFLRRFCKGISLADKLSQDKRFSIIDAVSMILSISRIVQIAHEHNVFHGDLKPSNIIVGDDKEITIIDWDTMCISSCVNDELLGSDVTVEQTAGTPAYMPLEQFQGARLTQQSDVYSLGIILYQLLTGETPFDNIGVKTPTQIAIYKQNHEPESILVKHPELGIPEDLGKLLEDSLKNDLNQRLLNVGEFIQRLETIGKISASKESTYNTPAQNTPAPGTQASPRKGKEHRLVLIGHTGAGKTVLAAGLYATQDKDFGVDDPGSKTQTGIHAINTKTIIEEGHWPAATSVGDITKLRFKINHKGKEEEITFDEYAGERMEMEDYENKILKTPDGAFVLINPGGKQWHNTRSKNSLISDLKHYIDLLSKKANNPPVAFVVTASDRLESDLKDFASTFQTYVDEIENYLIRKKCVYKVFHVSVSGVLEDQNHPHLAPKGIKDPFVWLLGQFSHRESMRIAKKISVALAVLFAIILLTLGGFWINDYSTVSAVRKELASIQTEYNTKMKNMKDADNALIEYRNNLVSLLNKNCKHSHYERIKTMGKCDQKCYPFIFYSSNKMKFDNNLKEVMATLDDVNTSYYTNELEKTLKKPTEANVKDIAEIEKWEPLLPEGVKSRLSLLNRYQSELPIAIVIYDFNALEDSIKAFISAPQTSLPQDLISKIQAFTNTIPNEINAQNKHKELVLQTNKLEKEAKSAAERLRFNTLLDKINNISDSIPNELTKSIQEWDALPTVLSESERNNKDYQIQEAYKNAKIRVEINYYNSLIAKLNSISESVPDNLQKDIENWENLPTNLTNSERTEKNNAIQNAYKNALTRVFKYNANKIMERIRQINVSTIDAGTIGSRVKEYMEFRNVSTASIDNNTVQNTFNEIEAALLRTINSYMTEQQRKARTKIQNSSTYQAPTYGSDIKNKILIHLPVETRNQLSLSVDAMIGEDYNYWLNIQKNTADSFVRRITNRSAEFILNELNSFCMENRNNPYLKEAETRAIGFVENEFNRMINDFNYTESAFNNMKAFSAKIRNTRSESLQNTYIYKFAGLFMDMMNNSRNITISRIQVRSDFPEGAYMENAYYKVGEKDSYRLIPDLSHSQEDSAVFKSIWVDLPFFDAPLTVAYNPWERFQFEADVWENIEWFPDSLKGQAIFSFRATSSNDSDEIELDGIHIRFYYKLDYKTIAEIYRESTK